MREYVGATHGFSHGLPQLDLLELFPTFDESVAPTRSVMSVVAAIPSAVTEELMPLVEIPVIGIGAGPVTDGQVLVFHDVMGLNPDFQPKFVRRYADLASTITQATREFIRDVFATQKARGRAYFDSDAILAGLGNEPKFGRKVWGLLSLELWHQTFVDDAARFRQMLV